MIRGIRSALVICGAMIAVCPFAFIYVRRPWIQRTENDWYVTETGLKQVSANGVVGLEILWSQMTHVESASDCLVVTGMWRNHEEGGSPERCEIPLYFSEQDSTFILSEWLKRAKD